MTTWLFHHHTPLNKKIVYSFFAYRTFRRDARSCARARLVITARVVVNPIVLPTRSNQRLVGKVEACKTVRAVEKKLQKKQLPFPLST